MSRFQEKLQVVKQSKAKVKELRRVLKSHEADFQCLEPAKSKRQIMHEEFYGAHSMPTDYAMQMHCMILHKDEHCPNITCPHIEWNKQYVDINAQLKCAKEERRQAILDVLHMKEKVADIKEYRRLKKLKKQQSQEVLHLYVAYNLAYDLASPSSISEYDAGKAKQAYETALAKYRETEATFDKARRKLWQRSK